MEIKNFLKGFEAFFTVFSKSLVLIEYHFLNAALKFLKVSHSTKVNFDEKPRHNNQTSDQI